MNVPVNISKLKINSIASPSLFIPSKIKYSKHYFVRVQNVIFIYSYVFLYTFLKNKNKLINKYRNHICTRLLSRKHINTQTEIEWDREVINIIIQVQNIWLKWTLLQSRPKESYKLHLNFCRGKQFEATKIILLKKLTYDSQIKNIIYCNSKLPVTQNI